jgi:pimeloyl-ACP methyl ester carboxylesterase
VDAPDVRFAKSGETNIAYAMVGDGPFDLVFVNGWVLSALEYAWEGPAAHFFRELASFSRLILFDKRGTGLSDRATGIPDLETRMDDIRAVMDAAGSDRAAIMGFSEGGPMTLLFAASYPSGRPRRSCTVAEPHTSQPTTIHGDSPRSNGRRLTARRQPRPAAKRGWTATSNFLRRAWRGTKP